MRSLRRWPACRSRSRRSARGPASGPGRSRSTSRPSFRSDSDTSSEHEAPLNHTLAATITGRSNNNPLRVEAWDATGVVDDLIDVATSDARGRFTMAVDADYVAAI